jgi:hypothetical protein
MSVEDVNRFRWFCHWCSPGMLAPILLVTEVALFLSERYRFWFGQWKGYSVLLGCAAVPMTLLAILAWFVFSRIFQRQFQFQLKSMLALLTVSALPFSWLAWDMRLANQQRDVAIWLTQHMFLVEYDYQVSAGTVTRGTLPELPSILCTIITSSGTPPGQPMLRSFFGQDFFADVVCVQGGGPNSKTNDELENFESLERLEELSLLGDDTVTDAGLRHLGGLRRLRRLNIGYTHVTDTGIANLSGLTNLRWLDADCEGITDRGLERIAEQFPNLQALDVSDTRVTDAGVNALGELRNLEQLHLFRVAVTDQCLKTVGRLTNLRYLSLDGGEVSDEGLAEIACLIKLEQLWLNSTHVTDRGLSCLANMHNLKSLSLVNTSVTDAGVESFKRALPGCEVGR